MKHFTALIESKSYFDQPVENKQEAYEKPITISIDNDYTTGNLLNFLCHQNYYKLISIDL